MTTPATDAARKLLPVQRDDLRRSGLTDETIREAGIHSESDHLKLTNMLGYDYAKKRGAALVIPYRERDGHLNGFARVKPLFPSKDRNGRPKKYLAPTKSKNRAYFPAKVIQILDDATVELLIVEGEKKALCCMQEGFWAIGLGGVYNWKDGRKADRLIPDLEGINWSSRPVRIVFDSDGEENPAVRDAESRLAAQVKIRGAVVKVVRLPDGPDGRKQGADDFLVAQGKSAFRKLLDSAVDPDDVDKEKSKARASNLDPVEEARRFLYISAHHADGPTLRFHRGSWYGFSGRRYREFDDDEVVANIYRHLDPTTYQITRGPVGNIVAALRSLVIIPSDVDRPRWLASRRNGTSFVAMENGILDVNAYLAGATDVLFQHSPEWFSTVCLSYPFNPGATCPIWLRVINQNLEGDSQRIAILQEFAGLCCVFDTSFQKFLMLTGDGGNGKSVYCALLTALLGLENVSHVGLEAFATRFQLHQTLGKLANIAAEVGEIDKVAEGMLKAFTSGDRMQFERKQKDPIEAMPTARLLIATNNLPRFTDRSSGIWRRMELCPFRVTISESDRIRRMDDPNWWREQGELPGAFNWAIQGLKRLRAQGGFTRSEICRHQLAAYRLESNPARLFLDERYVDDPQASIVTQEAYESYTTWCVANNYHCLASNMFGKEIRRAFPRAEDGKVYDRNGRRVPGYLGIGLKTDQVDGI